MNPRAPVSTVHAWMLALRPKTLPAAVAPVAVGIAAALADGGFRWGPALGALTGALLLQIAVNLANDYFDFVHGIDSHERVGPLRVTQSGLISPQRVKAGMVAVLGAATVVGFYLVAVGGWPILVVGLAAMAAALVYSGGPYPLASHGLADIFVFVFFGPVAVGGTYFVQTLQLNAKIVWASLPVGLLVAAILVVNNLRDINTDRRAGKRTLAVMLGPVGTRWQYALLLSGAYVLPGLMVAGGYAGPWGLLPLLSLPVAVVMTVQVVRRRGVQLNRSLSATALLALFFSLLLCVGLLM